MEWEILDFHTHPFSSAEENISNYPDLSHEGGRRMKEDMARCGISRIAGSVIRRNVSEGGWPALVRRSNEEMLSLREALGEATLGVKGDFYIPGIMIHPEDVEGSMSMMEEYAKQGVRLIGELVPYMHGWGHIRYDDPSLSPLWDLAGELSMVVSYHSMGRPDEEEELARRHPNTIFVSAHPGEKPQFLAHLERLKKYKNAYLDLSGTGLFRLSMLAHGVREVGAEKFLFGSDYPICSPGMNVGGVLYESITERDRALIFAGNAKRLLGL